MPTGEILTLVAVILVGVGGLWAVYGLVSHRIDQVSRDLGAIRDSYVRRDDFLRVIDRFEKKLDDHLRLAAGTRPPPPA